MKKTIAIVGIAAFGASTLHAQYSPDLTATEKAKLWSISASLRGFYDDNVTTLPKRSLLLPVGVSNPRDGFGIEVSPTIGLNHTGDATTISGRYTYDLKEYFSNPHFTDQSHQLDAKLQHDFSERYKLSVSESFVVAQEPTVIENGALISSPLRANGDNVRNIGKIDFTAELTKLFSLQLGYQNSLYMYNQNANDLAHNDGTAGNSTNPLYPNGYGVVSRSAQLDRMEHLASVNLLWRPVENTTGRFGYMYGQTLYTSQEPIIYGVAALPPVAKNTYSNIRNQRSHYFYVGVDQNFTPELTAQVRVGAEYVDYYASHNHALSPYADASVRYAYAQGSYAQLGVKQVHISTDLVGVNQADPARDEDATSIYLRGNQKIASRLNLSWLGQYQHSTVNGGGSRATGGLNGVAENFYIAQLNLSYQVNNFISAETGYEYDRLKSPLARGYSRNQVYIGIRASY